MTATTAPFQDPRRRNTETPWCVILANPQRDIFEHHHFATFFDAAVFHKKAEPVTYDPRTIERTQGTQGLAVGSLGSGRSFVVPTCQCGHAVGDHVTATGGPQLASRPVLHPRLRLHGIPREQPMTTFRFPVEMERRPTASGGYEYNLTLGNQRVYADTAEVGVFCDPDVSVEDAFVKLLRQWSRATQNTEAA